MDFYEYYKSKTTFPYQTNDLGKSTCYLLYNPLTNYSKIGITDNILSRLNQLSNQSGAKILILLYIDIAIGTDESVEYIEKIFKEYYKHKKIKGEWYNLTIYDILNIKKVFELVEGDMIKNNLKDYKEILLNNLHKK